MAVWRGATDHANANQQRARSTSCPDSPDEHDFDDLLEPSVVEFAGTGTLR